jgi:hypothetical protein
VEKSKWAVRSFAVASADDAELAEAERATGTKLAGPHLYRFEVFRWQKSANDNFDPTAPRTVFVEMSERVVLYVAGSSVLLKRDDGEWHLDNSMPT